MPAMPHILKVILFHSGTQIFIINDNALRYRAMHFADRSVIVEMSKSVAALIGDAEQGGGTGTQINPDPSL
jgi:hypothetical protein